MSYFNSRNKYVNKAIASALIAGSLATAGAALSTSTAQAAGSTRITLTFEDPALKKVLDNLVTKGTINGTQEKAILDAVKAASPVRGAIITPKRDGHGFGLMTRGGFAYDSARVAVITKTLNMTLADIQTQLQAGKSLADIAGANTQALINALVTYDTNLINSKVSHAKITPQNAAPLISVLTAKVTAEVNAKGYRSLLGALGKQMPMNPNSNQQSPTPSQ
jgi:hypothetical protein